MARGSPGVTLYHADWQVGDRTMKVKHMPHVLPEVLSRCRQCLYSLHRWR